MPKTNHHYVPQFYLRNFSSNGKTIGMYINRQKKFVKEASIKNQAYKKHLYGKTEDIKNTLMHIEGKVSKIIYNMVNKYKIPSIWSEDYQLLLIYLLLSEARVYKMAETQNNIVDKLMKTIIKMDKNSKVPYEQIRKYKISYEIPNLLPMQVAVTNFPLLYDLKVILIISNSDRRFVTSDNPLVRYNSFYVLRNYQLRSYGLVNMGIQLFYPLSPKVCLCLYDDCMYNCIGLNNNILVIDKGKQMDELNRLFILNSYEFLFFGEGITEKYINRIIGSYNIEPNLENEVTIFGNDNEKLIAYQNKSVKERIKIPFMLINPKLINMPLPAHMGGPIRPSTQQFIDKLSKMDKLNKNEIINGKVLYRESEDK